MGRARDRDRPPAAFHLLTLTAQGYRDDDDMHRRRHRFLMTLRKAWDGWSGWYVGVTQDSQRGVLHFHVVLDQRLPRDVFDRLRNLWVHVYGMGPGSFDVQRMRSAKGTAKYLAGYVTKRSLGTAVKLDGDGRLAFHEWPVSRHNGEPYVRDRFPGNAYWMSGSARTYTRPLVDFAAPAGAFRGLDGWHGVTTFAESPEHASAVLHAVLDHAA